ncbi:MAG: acyl carrier protein [Acidobacteriota bacterium]
MSELETKLQSCFAGVFPALPPNKITEASTLTVEDWDSIAHEMLITTIQEEFQVQLRDDEVEHLTSYKAWLERLK